LPLEVILASEIIKDTGIDGTIVRKLMCYLASKKYFNMVLIGIPYENEAGDYQIDFSNSSVGFSKLS